MKKPDRAVHIQLMDVFTGQTATLAWSAGWKPSEYDHSLAFTWTEGNWCCDCNRYREWLRATGEIDAAEDGHDICGEPRIRARYLEGTDPFDDWPADEAARLRLVAEIREARKGLEFSRSEEFFTGKPTP